jgi:hypothetical protein
MEMRGTHHLLVYVDDAYILGENINTTNKNTKVLSEASGEVGLEVNTRKTVCLCLANRMQDKIIIR